MEWKDILDGARLGIVILHFVIGIMLFFSGEVILYIVGAFVLLEGLCLGYCEMNRRTKQRSS